MSGDAADRRVIRRLAAAGARLVPGAGGEAVLSGPGGNRLAIVEAAILQRLLARGVLARDPAGGWRLSEAGKATARRLVAGAADLAAQHQERVIRVVEHEGRRSSVAVDLRESPLAWLRARKGRDGAPLIDEAAFAAGERLRSDFTRGQMMPAVTANWSLAGRARGGGHAGGMAELTDAALAARLRVERALDALGPELAGAVLDFCCFLKGIEQIESERGWPQRSAKLVLRLGLAALARHYGFDRVARGPVRGGADEDRAAGRGLS